MKIKAIAKQVNVLTPDILSVELHAKDTQLPGFDAGSHIDVYLPSGTIRQYSLCNQPNKDGFYKIAILKDSNSRGGSVEAHQILKNDIEIEISTPRNHFGLVNAEKYIFIAGGIGITPLLSMIYTLEAQGKNNWELHYGGRSLETMAFIEDLSVFNDKVKFVPFEEKGLIDLETIVQSMDENAVIYSCGPAPMLNALKDCCERLNKSKQLHIEHFGKDPNVETDAKNDHSFELKLANSNLILTVNEGQTIKEVLIEAGVEVPFSCEEGYCGSCETKVLDGIPEHNDSLLSDEEKASNKYVMVCVARCKSKTLTLAL